MSLSENQAPEIRLSFADDAVLKQRRQMFIALTLLLVALVMVLTKDREFWFPSTPVLQATSEPVEEPSPEPQAQSEAVTSPKQTSGTTTAEGKAAEAGDLSRARSGIRSGARRCEPDRASSPAKSRSSLETSTAPCKPAAILCNWTCARLPLPARQSQHRRHRVRPL